MGCYRSLFAWHTTFEVQYWAGGPRIRHDVERPPQELRGSSLRCERCGGQGCWRILVEESYLMSETKNPLSDLYIWLLEASSSDGEIPGDRSFEVTRSALSGSERDRTPSVTMTCTSGSSLELGGCALRACATASTIQFQNLDFGERKIPQTPAHNLDATEPIPFLLPPPPTSPTFWIDRDRWVPLLDVDVSTDGAHHRGWLVRMASYNIFAS